MNVCIDFLNSLPNILNIQQLLISHVHIPYFVVYPVKMVDTSDYAIVEFTHSVPEKLLSFKNPFIIHHMLYKECDKVTLRTIQSIQF